MIMFSNKQRSISSFFMLTLLLCHWETYSFETQIEIKLGAFEIQLLKNEYLIGTYVLSLAKADETLSETSTQNLGSYQSEEYKPTRSVKFFDSGSFQIQSQVNTDETTKLSYFSPTTITTTYNSKSYSLRLDKSSVKGYLNNNGYVMSPKSFNFTIVCLFSFSI